MRSSAISIHAPAKGATSTGSTAWTSDLRFQSTLPRRERPTRRRLRVGRLCDFNPRSREGSDHCHVTEDISPIHFNPRSREGSDARSVRERQQIRSISIHAPAKGATFSAVVIVPSVGNFNPRSREGSDAHSVWMAAPSSEFQSTLPRRERRRYAPFYAPTAQGFQSTLPRRERRVPVCLGLWLLIFQSTLPRRERLHAIPLGRVKLGISIHAPAKGATAAALVTRISRRISIHAPAKGATQLIGRARAVSDISIHAPAKGATVFTYP